MTAKTPSYGFGESMGWRGGSPFHGNVAASQNGKNVPSTGAANVPGPGGYDGPFGSQVNPNPAPQNCSGWRNYSCFYFYGNYGGPGWTGGQYAPNEWETYGDPFSPGIPAGLALPIDQQDVLYMNHDRSYSQARALGKFSYRMQLWTQTMADFTLTQGLHDLPFESTPTWDSYSHALRAEILFPIHGAVKVRSATELA